jgi:hypothetical protein
VTRNIEGLLRTEERVDLARYTLDGLEEDEREGLEARVLAGVIHVVGADRELEEFLRLAYHLTNKESLRHLVHFSLPRV